MLARFVSSIMFGCIALVIVAISLFSLLVSPFASDYEDKGEIELIATRVVLKEWEFSLTELDKLFSTTRDYVVVYTQGMYQMTLPVSNEGEGERLVEEGAIKPYQLYTVGGTYLLLDNSESLEDIINVEKMQTTGILLVAFVVLAISAKNIYLHLFR